MNKIENDIKDISEKIKALPLKSDLFNFQNETLKGLEEVKDSYKSKETEKLDENLKLIKLEVNEGHKELCNNLEGMQQKVQTLVDGLGKNITMMKNDIKALSKLICLLK